MSLILGVYSKNKHIDRNEFKPILDDFSLKGERKIQTYYYQKILFSSSLADPGSENIAQSKDDTLTVLFSGNLYGFEKDASDLAKIGHNFSKLNNPAEFILHSYEEYGDTFLKNINGTFAFSIYNRLKDFLILANDSFGIYPLFFYDSPDYCIFSTEYEPILLFKDFKNELDFAAISEFFSLGFPLGDKTFFRSIKNLHPGSTLMIGTEQTALKQYENLSIQVDHSGKVGKYAEALAYSFREALRIRLGRKPDLVCELTGGADTRLIMCSIPESQREKVTFQTEKNPYLNEEEDRDIIIAKMLASRFGLKHRILESSEWVSQLKEGFGSWYFKTRRVNSSFKPIAGLLGGELLGGISFKMSPVNLDPIDEKQIYAKLKNIFCVDFIRKIPNPHESLEEELKSISAENFEQLFLIRMFTRGFFTTIYKGARSGWLDPYSFPTRVEAVCWDKHVLRTILSIPKTFLAGYNLYNLMYKNHFTEAIEIPTNSPLAERPDSCIPPMKKGIEPKLARKPDYLNALKNYSRSEHTWGKGFYSFSFKLQVISRILGRKIIPKSHVEDHKLIAPFIDFEAWYSYFVGNI